MKGRIALLTADGVEDVEFFYPYYRFVEDGFDVDVITPTGGVLRAYRGMELQDTMALAGAQNSSYEHLFIPGGLAPAALQELPEAIAFVQGFVASGRPVGAVCHGPQLLAVAGLVAGRTMTAWHEVANDITAAGGTYVDEALVEDGQFFTSRKPGDLPRLMARILQFLSGPEEPNARRDTGDNA